MVFINMKIKMALLAACLGISSLGYSVCEKIDYVQMPNTIESLAYLPEVRREIDAIKTQFFNNPDLTNLHERRVIDIDDKKLHIEFVVNNDTKCIAKFKRLVSIESLNDTYVKMQNAENAQVEVND